MNSDPIMNTEPTLQSLLSYFESKSLTPSKIGDSLDLYFFLEKPWAKEHTSQLASQDLLQVSLVIVNECEEVCSVRIRPGIGPQVCIDQPNVLSDEQMLYFLSESKKHFDANTWHF